MDPTQMLLAPPAPAKRRGPLARFCLTGMSVIGAIVFGWAISASFSNALKPPTFRPRSAPILTRDPWISVWSTRLAEAYAVDEASADQRYKGRLVHVGGRVTALGKDNLGHSYVVLEGDETGTSGVRCFLANGAGDRVASLTLGESVSVEGQVEGKADQVLVGNCRLYVDPTSRR